MPSKPQPQISLPSAPAEPIGKENRLHTLLTMLPMTTFWALAAQGLLSVTRLLTTVTAGGKFGSGSEEQLGYYSNGFATLMVMVAVFEAFVTTPMTFFMQKKQNHERATFSGHMLIMAVLVIGTLLVVSTTILGFQSATTKLSPHLAAALVAMACMAPFQLLREFSRRWMLANLLVKTSAAFEFFFTLLFFIGAFSLLASDSVTAVNLFVTLALVNIIGLAGWWWLFRQRFDVTAASPAATLTEQIGQNLRYGRWVAGENVCNTLTMYFANWYLTYRLNEKAAGVFFACFTIVMLANPFLLGITSIAAPRAAQGFGQGGFPGLFNVLAKFGSLLMAVMIVMTAVLWFAGDQLTTMFFPTEYAGYFQEKLGGHNYVTGILGLALPAMGMSYIAAFGSLAADLPRDNFWSAVVGLVVVVLANLYFTDTSLMTVAISFVISLYVSMLCRCVFLTQAFWQDLKSKPTLKTE